MNAFTSSPYFVPPQSHIALDQYPSRVELFETRQTARAVIKDNAKTISKLAHRLYGEAQRSVLIVLQGMDTSGKDGTTEAIFHRTPPLNVKTAAFKAPSKIELAHDYLWRVHQVCPRKGHITVFNRSHYEDVLVVKVKNYQNPDVIEQRYQQINDFERMLSENGTVILKFMLHISHETQGKRLKERLVEPHKLWKFNPGDLDDRALWPDFMDAYQTMLRRTSTTHAPWYVIPSDNRSTRGAIVSTIVRDTLLAMDPHYPQPDYSPDDFDI